MPLRGGEREPASMLSGGVPPKVVVPVIEETIEVGKRRVDTGGVRVVKTVEEHSELVDEALMRDEVSVERRKVDRAVPGNEAPRPYWEGDTLVVPVVEEVLVVSRQLRVREEMLIHRRRTEFRSPQRVTLHREQVAIERIPPANPSNPSQDANMNTALVGVFENRDQATKAYNELLAAGFLSSDVTLRSADTAGAAGSGTATRASTTAERRDEPESTIGDWFRSLFGLSDDDDDLYVYDEAMRRGHYLVTVASVSDDRIERASDIMERCGSIDIEERATQWEREGWARSTRTGTGAAMTGAAAAGAAATGSTPTGTASAHGAGAASMAAGTTTGTGNAAGLGPRSSGTTQKIPVIEEELRVGKRVVGRGGVRVYSRVVDQPVEETVRLREERATVERRPTDRPATEADFEASRQGTMEVRESVEEPVVSKRARVTEEVEVGKDVRERSETVRDKVRHTEVQVEKTGDGTTGTAGTAGTMGAGTYATPRPGASSATTGSTASTDATRGKGAGQRAGTSGPATGTMGATDATRKGGGTNKPAGGGGRSR